jgi:hypothetical protein
MFFTNESGRQIKIMNKKPINLSIGGMIHGSKKGYYRVGRDRIQEDSDDDTIMSMIPSGCLVIPRPIVHLMDSYKGPICGKKMMVDLEPTIVQSGEIIVHPKYARKVMKYLKGKGVSLPLPSMVDGII